MSKLIRLFGRNSQYIHPWAAAYNIPFNLHLNILVIIDNNKRLILYLASKSEIERFYLTKVAYQYHSRNDN